MSSIGALTFLLADALARKLFTAIADKKTMQARDLVSMGQPATSEEVYRCLEQLKNAEVIAVDTSVPIADFRTYYITADGLATDRELRRIQAASATGTPLGGSSTG